MSIKDLIPWARAGLPAGQANDPFAAFQREMNRLFDASFRDMRAPAPFQAGAFAAGWPSIAVAEQDRAYVVTAELPGMDEKDIELALDEGGLVIRGEKKSERTDEKTHLNEHFWGRFERRVPLGPEVDREAIAAAFDKGVLTVTLPKSAQAASSSRRIPIGGAAPGAAAS